MNFSEFKAWLDGFSENIGDAPTPEQWAKVRAKLAAVNNSQVFNEPSSALGPPQGRGASQIAQRQMTIEEAARRYVLPQDAKWSG